MNNCMACIVYMNRLLLQHTARDIFMKLFPVNLGHRFLDYCIYVYTLNVKPESIMSPFKSSVTRDTHLLAQPYPP